MKAMICEHPSQSSGESKDSKPLDVLARLVDLANGKARNEAIRSLGRRCLIVQPLCPEEMPTEDDHVANGVHSNWVDDQLFPYLPFQQDLLNVGDGRRSVLEEAWPEGFDEVVFSSGAKDEHHAREILDPYLRRMAELQMPLLTDSGSTEKEMEAHLVTEFRKMIVAWRRAVFEALEQRAKGGHNPSERRREEVPNVG